MVSTDMVSTNDQANAIFSDARSLYDDALEMLAMGKRRNAAEKAWGATKRASDALILARTGTEPRTTGQTRQGLGRLRRQDPDIKGLMEKYALRQTYLHGGCFYDNDCDGDAIPDIIRETIDYIRETERLAGR
jgi:hypothetical protein